jgi:hypothetical protein
MPDISMCQNDKCNLNKECYRYMAIPSSYQSYADFNENNCESFTPINGRKIIKGKTHGNKQQIQS